MDLSVIIPCYNESHSIAGTVTQIKSHLDNQNVSFEIIVVNDGSTDETNEVAENLQVELISYFPNRGKGYAVKQGVENAKGKSILFIDADHTVSINNVGLFLESLKEYQIVIASKYLDNTNHVSSVRKVLGKSFAFIRRVITGLKYKDTQCGFKLFESNIAKELFSDLTVFGWCFDVEILILAKKRNYKVKELGVKLEKNIGGSQVHLISSSIKMFSDLFKIRLKHL